MNREKMNRKIYVLLIIMVLPVVGVMQLPAEKYKLYGYSDFQFFHSVSGFGDKKAAFFTQNRTNILLSSEVFKRWDFFLNIEFNGAFKLQPGYDPKTKEKKTEMEGNLELEEAWAGYTVSPKLKFRAGVFHAPFGSFNEIQDASPSYISVRPPIIYDDKFRSGYPTAIIPDRANLEVSGTFRKKDVSVDYHLYMGNGLGNMQSSGPKNFTGNTNMAVGARLRLNYDENLKIGVSSYFDNAVIAGRFYGKTYNEKRVLLSVDADYTLWRFNVNGEYFFNSNKNDTLGKFNRTFFYVNLNFELMKKVRIYAEIDTYQDKIPDKNVASLLGNGINKAIAGINFKPNWVTAIKAEVQHFFFKGKFKPSRTTFTASFSVIF